MHPDDAARVAEQFKGWMTRAELTWLARQAANHQRILEIGTYAGRSTAAMALCCPGKIVTIDIWRGELGTPELHAEDLMQLAFKNIGSLTGACDVEIRGMSSAALYTEWRHGLVEPFDMIFIDGNHDQAEVMFDLWACEQMLVPGGLCAGHDYGVGGVIPALEIELPEARQCCHSIWEWRKPE